MAPITALLVLGALFGGAGDVDDQTIGYTLDDEVDETWLQLFDRTGRPDPDGPMLQRFDDALYDRYEFDITVPDFPMATERRWARQRHGARMWVQSLSEFQLANRLQLRTELTTWDDGYVGLQYDRRQDRLFDRHQIRFDIGHRDIASTGVDAALRFYPGWDKTDVDVEGLVRYRRDGLGSAGLRVGTLDTFLNASFGLVEARGREVQEDIRHRDIPLTIGAEFASQRFAGIRGELYAGAVVPHTRKHTFLDRPERDHRRHRNALLGAALVEWDIPDLPVVAGLTYRAVDARMEWEFTQEPDSDRSVRETTTANRIYLLSPVSEDLDFEFSLQWTRRPETWTGPGVAEPWASAETQQRRDDQRMASFRTLWQITDVFGADLQFLQLDRDTTGPLELDLDGTFNRVVTRLSVQFSEEVWTSLGIGWTWDDQTAVYDGGGMTLIYAPGG